jgi:hypothetical protein
MPLHLDMLDYDRFATNNDWTPASAEVQPLPVKLTLTGRVLRRHDWLQAGDPR